MFKQIAGFLLNLRPALDDFSCDQIHAPAGVSGVHPVLDGSSCHQIHDPAGVSGVHTNINRKVSQTKQSFTVAVAVVTKI